MFPLLLVAKFRDPWVYSLVKHDGKNFIMIEANIWTLSTTPESQQGSFYGPYFLVTLLEVPSMENVKDEQKNASLRKNNAKRFAKQQRSNALVCVYCYFLRAELIGYQRIEKSYIAVPL